MKIRVIADLHKGASYELINDNDMDRLIQDNKSRPTVWLGDNLDYRNCIKEMLPKLDAWLLQLRTYFERFLILGNHEDSERREGQEDHVIIGKTILTHSHKILWSEKKLKLWAKNFKRGKGTSLLSRFINWCRELNDRELKEHELEKLSKFAIDHCCTGIVIAHVHPSFVLHYQYKGIKITAVPRGITDLEIE